MSLRLEGSRVFFFLPPELSIFPQDAFILLFSILLFCFSFFFFAFLLGYDIVLKIINAIQKGKYYSTLMRGTKEALLKILWPIWVTSDQKRESDMQ